MYGQPDRIQRHAWLWLIPFFLLVVFLAGRMLYADMVYVDEYFSIRISGGAQWGPLTLPQIWDRLVTLDNAAGMGVLYHWLLAGWMHLLGASTFSVRLFSLLIGLMALALTYRVGGRLFGRDVGLYASVLLGASAFYVDYMHEARAYTLTVFFGVWLIGDYMALVRSQGRVAVWRFSVLALLVGALAYTHYVALALVGALGLVHLTQWGRVPRRRWWWLLGAFIVGGALFLPWLRYMVGLVSYGASDTNRQATSMDTATLLIEFMRQFSNWNVAFLLVLGTLGLWHGWRRYRTMIPVMTLLVISLLLVVIVNALLPFMVHLRYVLFAFVPMAFIAGLGVKALAQRGVSAWLVVGVWGVIGVAQALNPAYPAQAFGYIYRPPWAGINQALEVMRPVSEADDVVLFHLAQIDEEPFMKFPLERLMYGINGRYDQAGMMNDSFTRSDNLYLQDVRAVIQDAPFVWQITAPSVPTTNLTDTTQFVLDTQYRLCGTLLQDDTVDFRLYARVPDGSIADGYFIANDGVQIGLYAGERVWQAAVGEAHIYYHALVYRFDVGVAGGLYSGAVHVLDADGLLVAQADFALPDGQRPVGCHVAQIDISDLPDGEYTVQTLAYNWQDGERLPIGDGDALVIDALVVK